MITSESFAAASIVILPDDVVMLTAPSPLLISSAATASAVTQLNDNVQEPFVFRNCPFDPSEEVTVNAFPPDVKIKLLPSEDTDSFASCN